MEAQQSKSGDFVQGRACEYHRRVSFIMMEGHRMRFCQGCHRFEPLAGFDDTSRRAASAHASLAESV